MIEERIPLLVGDVHVACFERLLLPVNAGVGFVPSRGIDLDR